MVNTLVHFFSRFHYLDGETVDTGGTVTRVYARVTCPMCIAGGFGPYCPTCKDDMTLEHPADRYCSCSLNQNKRNALEMGEKLLRGKLRSR